MLSQSRQCQSIQSLAQFSCRPWDMCVWPPFVRDNGNQFEMSTHFWGTEKKREESLFLVLFTLCTEGVSIFNPVTRVKKREDQKRESFCSILWVGMCLKAGELTLLSSDNDHVIRSWPHPCVLAQAKRSKKRAGEAPFHDRSTLYCKSLSIIQLIDSWHLSIFETFEYSVLCLHETVVEKHLVNFCWAPTTA